MKKNIVRVLSLLLVAAMLVSFASCTQTILVRFVDADGNDLNLGAVSPAAVDTTAVAPDTTASADTPTESTAPAPAETTTAAPAPGETTTAAPAPAETTTAAPAPTSAVPSTKDEICAFYAKAVNDIKNNGSASYNKKEYQTITNFNITGNSIADGLIKSIAGNYFKDESKAEVQTAEKGQDSSKSKMLGWTLTDNSKVSSATLTQNGGNYDITIKMADEDTPHKGGGSHLDAVGSVLLWEDIETELNGISQLKEWQGNVHVKYTNYTITATISPDGKLSALKHHTDVVIEIVHAKIIISLDNKSVAMENTCDFSNFAY